MKRELLLTDQPIDEASLIKGRAVETETGAVVVFLGVVRGTEEGERIAGLEYEAFREMAQRQFDLIFDEASARWPIQAIRLVHRVGRVPVREASLWVEVVGAHRGEAFEACQFVIDEMKRKVPIWKKPLSRICF